MAEVNNYNNSFDSRSIKTAHFKIRNNAEFVIANEQSKDLSHYKAGAFSPEHGTVSQNAQNARSNVTG